MPATGPAGPGFSSPGARTPRTPWPRRAAALFTLLGVVLATAPQALSASRVAGAREGLRRARAELTALDVRLSLIAERIHQGRVLMDTIRRDLVAARLRSERTERAATAAAAELESTVRRTYEGVGTTEGLAALIGSSSVNDLLQKVEYLSALAQRNARVASDAGQARQRAEQSAAQTGSLAAAQVEALRQLRDGEKDMRAAVAAQRRLIGRLDDRLKREIALAVTDRITAPPAPPPSGSGTDPAPGSGGGGGPPSGGPPPGPPPPPENKIDALIYSIWGDGPNGRVAECIADRESRDNPNARNASSGAAGLFQLMPFWWDGNNAFGWKFDPYDAEENAKHAYLIWKRDGWNPWTTKYLCT
jgi:hypothetical protein